MFGVNNESGLLSIILAPDEIAASMKTESEFLKFFLTLNYLTD